MDRLKNLAVLAAEACADLANQAMDERDALRAEVAVYKRALDALAEKMQGQSMDCWRCPVDAYDDCFKGRDWRNPPDDWHGTCVKHMLAWAISEAGKG